jgi:hypothetical protein
MASEKTNIPDAQDSATEADLAESDVYPQAEPVPTDSQSKSDVESREDVIRRGAYALYEARQGVGGSEEEDWLQAEALMLQTANHGV